MRPIPLSRRSTLLSGPAVVLCLATLACSPLARGVAQVGKAGPNDRPIGENPTGPSHASWPERYLGVQHAVGRPAAGTTRMPQDRPRESGLARPAGMEPRRLQPAGISGGRMAEPARLLSSPLAGLAGRNGPGPADPARSAPGHHWVVQPVVATVVSERPEVVPAGGASQAALAAGQQRFEPGGAAPEGPPPPARIRIPLYPSGQTGAVEVNSQGNLVSLFVRDAPLGQVLGVLAQHRGLNLVTAEDITAKVSATLDDVPFEEALTNVLAVAGYTWVRQGDILLVTSINSGSTLPPHAQGRRLRVFSLDFVSATDLSNVIQGLLSPAGQSFVTQSDSSDNRKTQELLVVEDLPEYVARIEEYIRQVDQPPRQVLIEAHVLSVDLDDNFKHGINWEYLDKIGLPSVALRTQGFADAAKFAAGTSPAFFFNIEGTDLDLLLEALETTSNVKTLANPKVLALNGQQARIQIGEQLGYRVTTTTQTSTLESVEFLDVGVVLTVTPWITRDNRVIMQVKPEISSGQINPDTQLPDKETTEAETALMLPDGHGMVIGGLIKEEDTETQQKIPVLGDWWIIGRLFQKREVVRKRSEIIITLLPRVVPYEPVRQQAECEQFRRATTPLFYGPLLENPRPEEPKFPDAGQRKGVGYKLQHFCPLPDTGGWGPQFSSEICHPGMMYPGESQMPAVPGGESVPVPEPAGGDGPMGQWPGGPAPVAPAPHQPPPGGPGAGPAAHLGAGRHPAAPAPPPLPAGEEP